MEDLRNKIEYLAHKKPDKLAELVKEMYHKAPQDIEYMLEQFSGGEHLTNREDYEKCVKKLKWIDNRGAGAKWQFDDIIRLAEKTEHVDFDNVEYTEFEFAYLVNLLYAMFCKVFSDSTYYLKMAKSIFDYSNVSEEQHYGDFFKPMKQQKSKHNAYDYRNEDYRYENENRRTRYEYENYDPRYEDEESRRRRYRSESDEYENNYDRRRRY